MRSETNMRLVGDGGNVACAISLGALAHVLGCYALRPISRDREGPEGAYAADPADIRRISPAEPRRGLCA